MEQVRKTGDDTIEEGRIIEADLLIKITMAHVPVKHELAEADHRASHQSRREGTELRSYNPEVPGPIY